MTKEDALQKIEELKQFVANLDKQEQLGHGDLVYYPDKNTRIVISTRDVKEKHLDYSYLIFDKSGDLTNFFNDLSNVKGIYTKIRNVFNG